MNKKTTIAEIFYQRKKNNKIIINKNIEEKTRSKKRKKEQTINHSHFNSIIISYLIHSYTLSIYNDNNLFRTFKISRFVLSFHPQLPYFSTQFFLNSSFLFLSYFKFSLNYLQSLFFPFTLHCQSHRRSV